MQILLVAVASFVFSASAAHFNQEDSGNVIVNYETDTHSRYEAGQPGKAVRGSYRYR